MYIWTHVCVRAHHQGLSPLGALQSATACARHIAGADELRACDVWALGLLLVRLLTGAPSTAVGRESRDDVGGVARSVSDLDVTEAAMAVSRASLATQKLSHSMLQPSPARRPTAAAVLAQVDALLRAAAVLDVDAFLKAVQDASAAQRTNVLCSLEDHVGMISMMHR